jgi:hypothetical protein
LDADGGPLRVHLRFESARPLWNKVVSASVDDLELLPVLSGPSERAWEAGAAGAAGAAGGARRLIVAEAAGREAAVHVPSAAELAGRGLAHLLRGAQAAEADAGADRVRLHATLALALSAEGAGCAFEAQLFYRAADGRARALPLGCALVASGAYVRGTWAQCALTLPVGVTELRARAAPATGAPAACVRALARGELLVFLAAHSAFAECETGFFPAGGPAADTARVRH